MDDSYGEYPENFFEINVTLMTVSGMWVPSKKLNPKRRYFLLFYNFLYIFYTQVLYTPLEIAMLNETVLDFQTCIEHVGMLLTHILGTIKVIMWHYRQKDIMYLLRFLHDDKYKYESYGDFRPGLTFRKSQKISKRVCIFAFFVASFVPLSKFVACYDYILDDEKTFLNKTCKHYLPYYSRIPFPTTDRFVCGVAMVFQIIPMTIYAWQIVTHDILFSSILSCLGAHFLSLQGAFRTIRPRCLKRLGLPEDYDILHDTDNPALVHEMAIEMKKATYHLQQLIAIRDQFEGIYTYITLIQTLITLFVIATCLFMVTSVPLLSGQFAAQFEYFLAIMVQFTLYSWFGNEITLAFSGLLGSLYEGDWLSAREPFKKSMLINMNRIQRSYYITIGKFGPLTLETFVSLLRGSYSYYTVLSNRRDVTKD